jgi:DNA mismatch repair protein MutS
VAFASILFEEPPPGSAVDDRAEPAIFDDLNLDQVVAAITAGKEEYSLAPFFNVPLTTYQAIDYRQEVFRDLANPRALDCVDSFGQGMREMRRILGVRAKLHYRLQMQRLFLAAVRTYCAAVETLAKDLSAVDLRSRGLIAFREHLETYAKSVEFADLARQAATIEDKLSEVRYCLRIIASRIDVARYDAESDYSTEVAATFEKFRRGEPKSYLVKFNNWLDMNHVEAEVLDRVALLHPEAFAPLEAFDREQQDYLDHTIAVFDREIQFYVSYLEFTRRLEKGGLSFCEPRVSAERKDVRARATFDLALATKLVPKTPVVCNDFELSDPERIVVVSGPNQGGKTTFARTFGQLHYVARLGCPVPGQEAEIFLSDRIFTHFEREEDLEDLNGKLQSDLIRIHEILEVATPRSVIIMNEIFTSTTLKDAIFLGTRVLERIIQLDLLAVCVTFVDELAALGPTIVSMMSTVVPDNPAERTFLVVRRPADGLSHAAVLAAKYGLTYDRLRQRLAS